MNREVPQLVDSRSRNTFEWLSVILVAAFAISSAVYFVYASPYLGMDPGAIAAHSSHRVFFFVHIICGGFAMFVGPWMFWSGVRQKKLGLHRILGKVYLISGAIGVMGGMAIAVLGVHEPKSFGISLFTLGFVWLVCGAMAYRSIRNWQIKQHKEWMIRSFALTLTFVTCRFVGKVPLFGHLGAEAVTALIWTNWVLTLFLTEVAIQWRKTKAARL